MRLILTAFALAFAAPAAAAIIQPVSVTASDTFSSYDASNLINGSGLSGGLHDTNWKNMWQTTWDDVPHYLVFDLGQTVSLTGTQVWQYAADFSYPWYETDRGVQNLGITISLDGVNFTSVADVVMERASMASLPAQVFALTGDARYVRFDLNSNYGGAWTGLSEVRFSGAVPEAATWAMMILGFGLVGAAARRRRMAAA